MTSSTLDAEPACPGSPVPVGGLAGPLAETPRRLVAERRTVGEIDPAIWDGLAARNPWATPFSSWAFQRAWWDAYGANALDETIVVLDGDGAAAEPVAIVPLMHRHEAEPTDALTHTTLRHGSEVPLTPVPPTATAIFLGATYHADYATILADPADLPEAAEAVVEHLARPSAPRGPGPGAWDVVDLRRLRCGDPAADALAAAFGRREIAEGWTLNVEREDVCPVIALPIGGDFESYLSTLGKKDRHEIRRKVRRAEAAGELRLDDSPDPLADLGSFIDLHQKRWGSDGIFPPTPGGDQSRVFFRRLFELFGPDGALRLTFLTSDGRRIAAGMHFESSSGVLFYNAGVDPDARDLSPGVVMTALYVQRAIAAGCGRLDFLRGDEPYKYEWGAQDEHIQRLLVRRTITR